MLRSFSIAARTSFRSSSSDSAAASCTSASLGCRSAGSASSLAASFGRPAFRSICAPLVQPREQQPIDVRGIAAADADAAGIRVDQLAAMLARLVEAEQPDDARPRPTPHTPDAGAAIARAMSAIASSAMTPKNTLRVQMPHSSCSTTAARVPGTRSTGPCASMPDCTASVAAIVPTASSVRAAGRHERGPSRQRDQAEHDADREQRDREVDELRMVIRHARRAYNHPYETSILRPPRIGGAADRHGDHRPRGGAAVRRQQRRPHAAAGILRRRRGGQRRGGPASGRHREWRPLRLHPERPRPDRRRRRRRAARHERRRQDGHAPEARRRRRHRHRAAERLPVLRDHDLGHPAQDRRRA